MAVFLMTCGYVYVTGVAPIVFSGGFGGACLWLVVYPFDCVKSRIQVMSMIGRQEGFFKTMMTIMRTEGRHCVGCFMVLGNIFKQECLYNSYLQTS